MLIHARKSFTCRSHRLFIGFLGFEKRHNYLCMSSRCIARVRKRIPAFQQYDTAISTNVTVYDYIGIAQTGYRKIVSMCLPPDSPNHTAQCSQKLYVSAISSMRSIFVVRSAISSSLSLFASSSDIRP